eukprot:jgi/Chrzof1/6363/Cz18g05220.t1
MDASELARFNDLLSADDVPGFVRALEDALSKYNGNFQLVLKSLGNIVFSKEDDDLQSLQLVTSCLSYIEHYNHNDSWSAATRHLLLEVIPPNATKTLPQDSPILKDAAQLFQGYCTPATAKLAMKVAMVYDLKPCNVIDWEGLVCFVDALLADRAHYTTAVRLLMHFEGLDDHVDKASVLGLLVSEGQESLAEKWATGLGHDFQVVFVEACVALDRLKPASHAVRALGLQAEFPDVESLYKTRSLARLLDKRLWPVALSFVGNDAALQRTLVREMLACGESELATQYATQLGIPESALQVDPEAVAAEEAARKEQYLQLAVPLEAVAIIADATALEEAGNQLLQAAVVGIDVEWKPNHEAGSSSAPASLLQVAVYDAVFLFDLLTLAAHHPTQLSACLAPVLTNPSILKLGFELLGDLRGEAVFNPGYQISISQGCGGAVYLLHADDAAEQLAEISKHFGIRFDEGTAMSRCSSCNAAAFQLLQPKATARGLVPDHVYDLVDEFWRCGVCGKVYWMGPKSYAALSLMEGLLQRGERQHTPLRSMLRNNDDVSTAIAPAIADDMAADAAATARATVTADGEAGRQLLGTGAGSSSSTDAVTSSVSHHGSSNNADHSGMQAGPPMPSDDNSPSQQCVASSSSSGSSGLAKGVVIP